MQPVGGRPVVGFIGERLGAKGRGLHVVGPLNGAPVKHARANARPEQHTHPAQGREFRFGLPQPDFAVGTEGDVEDQTKRHGASQYVEPTKGVGDPGVGRREDCGGFIRKHQQR